MKKLFLIFATMLLCVSAAFAQQVKIYKSGEIVFEMMATDIDSIIYTKNGDVITEGIINGYLYVDLGLPSGVKWSTMNVGASSPEDYGDYFAWGETSTKSNYAETNSLTYCDEEIDDISGNPSYDVARAKWGGSWRMPTTEECQELANNCKWEWTAYNSVKGMKVTGPNGNSIFLPAAGICDGKNLNDTGSYSYYWSSTPMEAYGWNAYIFTFSNSGCKGYTWTRRYKGLPVRPVSD